MIRPRLVLILGIVLLGSGCAAKVPPKDYVRFRTANPKSILIIPVVNRSVDVDAPDYFLSTISRPLAERGYYVYPVYMVKRLLEDDGLSDANLVHAADPTRLSELLGGPDAILYISIERWDARYVVLSTTVTVEFKYILKCGKTGEELWQSAEQMVYQPQNNNSGGGLGGLIAKAIAAAITKAAPNYIPLAKQANEMAVTKPYQGLPAGPYHGDYRKDLDKF